MFVRVPIPVDGPYAPAPIPGLVRANYPRARADPERLQGPVRGGLAVISVGGDRTRHAVGAPPDPADGRRFQGGGPASPEITARSQAWTAPTTSSGPGTARGVAEPAIQSEITVMRARNWPSASIEARMTKILVRRADLASSGIC